MLEARKYNYIPKTGIFYLFFFKFVNVKQKTYYKIIMEKINLHLACKSIIKCLVTFCIDI